MKKWILKAITQKIISFFPGGHKLNLFFQKYITKGVYLTDEYFTDRLTHAKHHLEAFEQFSAATTLENTLEIGTGWYPVVPISLFLYGAHQIYSDDIYPLCNKKHIITTIKKFIEFNKNGALKNYITIKPDRFKLLEDILEKEADLSFSDITTQLHIKLLLEDARHLSLSNESINLISSNNTFEHIYSIILKDILKEFKRVIKKGGVMSHAIDMSDHFAHFDKSITVFNYLKFSKEQWSIIDNSIQPQSRLRISDYRELYAELAIPISKEFSQAGSMYELKSIHLNKQFVNVPLSELVIIHCTLISAF